MKEFEILVDETNVEQQLAFDFIANTNTSLFVTGKAGTGKTTFIKRILGEVNKNFIVLAPTGIAAIAVGGQTMHSFFGFPLEVLGPHAAVELSLEKRLVLEKVDTIVIDEASMVRSDMVDAMDRCLRGVMHTHMPFGGKQVVFVGDLYQLPPVVDKGSVDDEMLSDLYGGGLPFFYKAHALKRINLPKIEFKRVYRQDDKEFVELLNKMRVGKVTSEELALLNSRVCRSEEAKDYSVTLTAYNYIAGKINEEQLGCLEGDEFVFVGKTEGEFKRKDSPAPEKLKLKVGAQVIFCRNNYAHKCANGTIAKVVELDEHSIKVRLEGGREVAVEPMTWESRRSVYNKETKKLESEIIGTYTQYPLKLAWAITIHKSQGMTFDRMHLDLTRGTFAPGQAYVAISRMRSLEGLTLSNPIHPHHITLNPEVRAFSNSFNDMHMINDELEMGKVVFKYIQAKKHDMAAAGCLVQVISKAEKNDLRNAALLAKRMFDIMLDDEHLFGLTEEVALLKDCSMTCNFLNAVFCLYGNRYEEAIGYANMVLSQRSCLEAMYVKGRALYALGKYNEAYEVNYQMITATREADDSKMIDKKQYLFEARLNVHMGNPNIPICKQLIRVCPECIDAYLMIRSEALRNGMRIEIVDELSERASLINAFNNVAVAEVEFKQLLADEMKNQSSAFYLFKRHILKIAKTEPTNEAF